MLNRKRSPPLTYYLTLLLDLLISQATPMKPGLQEQVNPFRLSLHLPPLAHGLLSHSFISAKRTIVCTKLSIQYCSPSKLMSKGSKILNNFSFVYNIVPNLLKRLCSNQLTFETALSQDTRLAMSSYL